MIGQIVGYVLVVVVWTFVKVQFFIRKEQKKEAAIYCSLMVISMIIGSLLIYQVELPSIVLPLQIIFEPIGKMLLQQ